MNSNSLRGAEFRRLLGDRTTLVAIGVPALAVAIYFLATGAPGGLALAVLVALIGLVVVWFIADHRAGKRFWEVYAETRGLKLEGLTVLPRSTPFLQQGMDRYASPALTGELAPGVVGTIGLLTVKEPTVTSDGPDEKDVYFTFAMAEPAASKPYMRELYCKGKFGMRSLEKVEDAFRRNKQRVTLESDDLLERYEIFVAKGQDEVWTRRLFSPSFIVWLAERSPAEWGFELVDGTLVSFVPDRHEDAIGLDALAAATGRVAQRLLEESAQTTARAADADPGR